MNKAGRLTRVVAGVALVGSLVAAAGCAGEPAPGDDAAAQQSTAAAPAGGVVDAGPIPPVEPIAEDPEPELPATVTDADGEEVTVEDASRIVPLDRSATLAKTLIGLGAGDRIVAQTVSNSEPQLEGLPEVTERGHSINVEAVLEADPTLVVTDGSVGPPEAIEQLADAGVTVVNLDLRADVAGAADDIRAVAAAVGLPEEGEKLAERTEKEIEDAVADAAERAGDSPRRAAFLLARGGGDVFFLLGRESGATGLIEAAGGLDAAAEAGVDDRVPATAESLADIDPEAFVMMTNGLESLGGLEGLLAMPGVPETKAGQDESVVTLPDGDALAFGPNTGVVIDRLSKALYEPGEL